MNVLDTGVLKYLKIHQRTKNLIRIFEYLKNFPENPQDFSWSESLLRDVANNWWSSMVIKTDVEIERF